MTGKKWSHFILLCMIGILLLNQAAAQQLAFPGAEGFGRFATGGRKGEVYHVTNLNDSGAGSLRDAVSKSNRIVVFDVGGIIHIKSRIVVSGNVYIAGQTAPGGGITIYGNGLAFNASNNITRYIRIRMGKNGDSGKDALSISSGQNKIFDHVSISWGRDGTLDVNGSGIDNLTFQDCIISQGINNTNHSTGGLMQSGKWSMIRSLYHSNKTRNPKARGQHEFINSILYNWREHGYIMGDTQGKSECNLIGNYFIYGPSSNSNTHITGTTAAFHVYAHDNWIDSNKDGVLNGSLLTNYKTATVVNTPFPHPGVNNVLSAQDALKHVIDHVGASLARDAVDEMLIRQLLSYGKEGRIVNTEDDNGIPNNVGTVANGRAPLDTDKDGMPDEWEIARGLNPRVADDKGDDDNDGYTNIEEYLSCLVGEGDDCGVRRAPATYVFSVATNANWNTVTGWTPQSLPLAGDTAIIRKGEAQISGMNIKAETRVEREGILRLTGNSEVEKIRMQGGILKVFTSTPEFTLTSSVVVESASEFMSGSISGTVFTLKGTLSGTGDIRKTSVGILSLHSDASSYKGNWIVRDGVLRANTAKALGSGIVKLEAGKLEIMTPMSISGLEISSGEIGLNGNLTVNSVKINGTDLAPGRYTAASLPDYITGTGTLIVNGPDCSGVFNGEASIDACGECSGGQTGKIPNACMDCNGDREGTAYLDDCGVCVGGTTGFEECSSGMEAEEACEVDGILLEDRNTGFSGQGYVNTTNASGAYVGWVLHSAASGSYTITFRFANGGDNLYRDARILVNGEDKGTLVFPPTGAWTSWTNVGVVVHLSAGVQELRLEAVTEGGLANLDKLHFSEGLQASGCVITGFADKADKSIGHVYPNPTSGIVHITNTSGSWRLTDALGVELQSGSGEAELDLSAYPAGVYHLLTVDRSWKVIRR